VVSSTPRPHFTPGKDPVPILQETGWAPGPVWMLGKSHPHRDSIPDRPARSQSLYRLRYPAHHVQNMLAKIYHNGCRILRLPISKYTLVFVQKVTCSSKLGVCVLVWKCPFTIVLFMFMLKTPQSKSCIRG
jgi:hypothetical protein